MDPGSPIEVRQFPRRSGGVAMSETLTQDEVECEGRGQRCRVVAALDKLGWEGSCSSREEMRLKETF